MATANNIDKTQAQVTALVCRAIYETVEGCPGGAPCSSIYLALQEHGYSLETYQNLENGLVQLGVLIKRGDLLFADAAKARKYGLA